MDNTILHLDRLPYEEGRFQRKGAYVLPLSLLQSLKAPALPGFIHHGHRL
jgi:hypothetical protein